MTWHLIGLNLEDNSFSLLHSDKYLHVAIEKRNSYTFEGIYLTAYIVSNKGVLTEKDRERANRFGSDFVRRLEDSAKALIHWKVAA